MAAIAAAIIGGGALAGTIGGGAMSQQNASSAGHQAQDSFNWGTGQGMQRLLNALYGSGSVYQDQLSSVTGSPQSGYQIGARPTYGSDGILGKMQGVANQFQQGSQGIMQGYNNDTANLMGDYKAQTQQLDTLGAGAEAMAKQWGAGQANTIKTDAAQSLKNANRMGDAALNQGGFNSPTYRANQYGANAAQNQLATNKSLQDLANQQISQQEGARTNRINTLDGRYGNQTALQANRDQGSTSLQTGFLGTQSQLNAAPLQTELQAMQSNIMNPYLGTNTSAYFPQSSALGSALQSAGSAAGGLAGYQYGQSQQGQQNQSLLQQLQAMLGGGSGGGSNQSGGQYGLGGQGSTY